MHQMRIGAALQRLSVCLVMIAPINLGACAWLEDQYTTDAVVTQDASGRPANIPDDGPFVLWRDCIPADRASNGTCPEATLAKIQRTRDPVLRDRLQDHLLALSEKKCEQHQAGIVSTQAGTNLALNTVTTGLSATAAIVVAPATNILAALGAIASGTRSHFNADIYQKFVAPAVVRKINDTRPEKLKEITAKRMKQPTDITKPREIVGLSEYTAEAAVGDVERYNHYCSFTWALASLTDTTVRFSDTAAGIEQRINLLRKMQADNVAQIEKLKGDPNDITKGPDAARRLHDTNADISRQIMILQHQLLTAPQSVDPKSTTGSPG
ncbi:MAG: hypothetical protein KIT25_02310 [Enhydrobacter sp.]|nr:MAG: hypothetical protein KIT25_02310 [Enhydrobacter sp.]